MSKMLRCSLPVILICFRVVPGSQFALPDPRPAGLELSFPFDEGFTVAWMGWQFDVSEPGMALKVPNAPVNSVVRAVHIRGAAERDTTSFSLAASRRYSANILRRYSR